MGPFFNWLTNTLGGKDTGRRKTVQWLLLLGLLGIGFMLVSSMLQVKEIGPLQTPLSGSTADPPSSKPASSEAVMQDTKFQSYEDRYETALKEILEQIIGVGEVDVMVTLESTEEIVVEKDQRDTQSVTQEKADGGGTRHITDVGREGEVVLYDVSGRDGSQVPLVVKTIKPKIRGVVVVARGAENMTVKKLIVDSVERGLAVPAHRISVVPRKQQ
ncbi:stage III sporulation protein AG [Paenibacillus turpanensis]|uniref:stage III sporulation protein AG n=1 Tax=Paenibacillus turpanensis TaxID=2689078 RepID=UPI001FB64E16|nr:stage III sporulation protein AG [Paenibacillus turpanensis]